MLPSKAGPTASSSSPRRNPLTLLAKKQPDTNTRLAAERQEVARINQRDAELDAKLTAALLAGDNTAVDKLESAIATLRREVERRHRTIVLLEKENVAEQTDRKSTRLNSSHLG